MAVAEKLQDKAKLFDDFVAAEQISVLGLSFEDHTMETLKWQHDGFPSTAAYAFFFSERVPYTSELFAWGGILWEVHYWAVPCSDVVRGERPEGVDRERD